MTADYNGTDNVSLEQICDWMSYCTHHSNMDAPQNVHVYVLSDVPVACMFSYTQHSSMDTPQYVDVDVSSDYFCYWMFYYTHHSNMDALQYVQVDVPSD